jgi:hypothetical protein
MSEVSLLNIRVNRETSETLQLFSGKLNTLINQYRT